MTLKPPGKNKKPILFHWLLMLILATMTVGLSYAVLSLPSQTPGLSQHVTKNIELSGVSNPVTAVLLNFRGYDTLLEMGVLLLALLSVWSLNKPIAQSKSSPSTEAVLDMLPRLLVPLLIMVSGYLLWVGGHAPGGAFQAGAVLAAAGVLLLLTGWCLDSKFAELPLRITLVLGLTLFILVGMALILLGGHFLEYPVPFAGTLILLIEAAATLSIGITLTALFLSNQPERPPP
jgi:multisubunit Na+/H+ antiporter MnhB subunit